MSEGLAKKKRIQAGHKGSATRMLHQVEALLADSVGKAEIEPSKEA